MRGSKVAFSARAGLMWPPVSLEHEGADWHVEDSITPVGDQQLDRRGSAAGRARGHARGDLGEHKLRATAAIMAANDTAGTLLTFRGWALHDRTTLAFRRQPLPPLDEEIARLSGAVHAPFARRRVTVSPHRPGYYAKLDWQPPVPVRIELFRYDNRADPEAVNQISNGAGGPHFNHVGLIADLGSRRRAQGCRRWTGARAWASSDDGRRRWVDNRFRSAFALLTRPFGPFGLAARVEAFDTRNRGSDVDDEYDENGWSAMLAAQARLAAISPGLSSCSTCRAGASSARSSALLRGSARPSSRPNCECAGNHARKPRRLPSRA